jgi:hypothetical protein
VTPDGRISDAVIVMVSALMLGLSVLFAMAAP